MQVGIGNPPCSPLALLPPAPIPAPDSPARASGSAHEGSGRSSRDSGDGKKVTLRRPLRDGPDASGAAAPSDPSARGVDTVMSAALGALPSV